MPLFLFESQNKYIKIPKSIVLERKIAHFKQQKKQQLIFCYNQFVIAKSSNKKSVVMFVNMLWGRRI